MPPITDEEIRADQATDDKLAAVFAAEIARTDPAEDTSAADPTPETPVEAHEAPVADETPDTPPSETAPDDPEIAAYLEKYGGDPNKALKAAVEAQKLIGKQGSELGEYRREFEERIAEVQRQAAEQIQQVQLAQQQAQYAQQAPNAINTALEQGNYYGAAEAARQAGDPLLYNHVMTQWFADPDQAFGAQAYHTNLAQQEAEQRILQQMEQRLAPLQEATQPLLTDHAQGNYERELRQFAQGKADIEQVAPMMMQVAQEKGDFINRLLADDSPSVREEAFNYLYKEARDRVSDTLAKAAAQADTAAAQAAEQAKIQATVGSPTTASQTTSKTPVQQWRENFSAFLRDDSDSITSGLTRD